MSSLSRYTVLARGLEDVIGLPVGLTIVVLIVVPVLVIFSTGLLLYYYLKARASKRIRNRLPSKSSVNTNSTDGDLEMTFKTSAPVLYPAPSAVEFPSTFVTPAERTARTEAKYDNLADSKLFQVDRYGHAYVQHPRDAILPPLPQEANLPDLPPSPTRPKTAPNRFRTQYSTTSLNHNRSTSSNSTISHDTPSRNPSNSSNESTRKLHKRSSSLGKPMRPSNRPTHSPAGSIRSLSIFPPKHYNPSLVQSPTPSQVVQSPTLSQPGYTSPMNLNTPSPPLSPFPYSQSRSPQYPFTQHIPMGPPQVPRPVHSRHPSIDRNSQMPIAPAILIPTDRPGTSRSVLPTVEETTPPKGYDGGYTVEIGEQKTWQQREKDYYL
jgi:hypothetical protein